MLLIVIGARLLLASNPLMTTVEFTSVIHFLTPAGDGVEVGPGVYEVGAADSWLKFLPEGEAPSSAILIDATQGPHEEEIAEPLVRAISSPDTPDVLQVTLLMPDGVWG